MKKILLILSVVANLVTAINAQVEFHQGKKEDILHLLGEKLDSNNISKTISLSRPELKTVDFDKSIQKVDDVNVKIFNSSSQSKWVIKIESKETNKINLIINELKIPSGSNIYIYNRDLTSIMGPINNKNSKTFFDNS